MTSRRPQPRTGASSAIAALAIWLLAALSGTRAPAPSDGLELHAVSVEALSAPLPAVRQVAVELSTPIGAQCRLPSIGFGIDRSADISIAAVVRMRPRSIGSGRLHVRPRRLAFRYDATAPPAVL